LVGSAINIAARVCAIAGANEVLATDTVRALTRTSFAARFVPRGTPRLKGITEPIAVYRVLPVAGAGPTAATVVRGPAARARGLAVLAGAAAILIVVAAVLTSGVLGGRSPTASGPGPSSNGVGSASASDAATASGPTQQPA